MTYEVQLIGRSGAAVISRDAPSFAYSLLLVEALTILFPGEVVCVVNPDKADQDDGLTENERQAVVGASCQAKNRISWVER